MSLRNRPVVSPQTAHPLGPGSRLSRWLDREGLRRRTLRAYRFAGPFVLLVAVWYGLAALGLVGEPLESNLPGSLYMLLVLLTTGVALASPVLLVVAVIGGLAMARDWRFAAPLWMFALADGLFLAFGFLLRELPEGGQDAILDAIGALLLAAAAWATVVGYRCGR